MLTQEQADKIIAITNKDCGITGALLAEQGAKTCAVGALMIAAGVEVMRGQTMPRRYDEEVLFDEYGLDTEAWVAILDANDSYATTIARRKAVAKVVQSLVQ